MMVFDLLCRRCGRRDQRTWTSAETVTVTPCGACDQGMSVVGIAFFQPARAAA